MRQVFAPNGTCRFFLRVTPALVLQKKTAGGEPAASIAMSNGFRTLS